MKTFIMMVCIICTTCWLKGQNIKQVEYFIDKDKGVGKNTKLNLTAAADSSYQININVSGISNGFHKLYIRSKDSEGQWSLTAQKTIEVTGSFAQPQITTGEYFFDKDPGYGKGKKITVSPKDSDVVKTFAPAVAALNTGFHKLYVRFRDNENNWSLTLRRNIEIIKTADTVKIVEAEYFFEADKGYSKVTAKLFATPLPDGKFKFKIPFNKIPADASTLFIRVKDSLGKWSFTKVDTFSVQSFAKTLITSDTKTSDENANAFSVFPNPASQSIHINYGLKNKSALAKIFDEYGKPILQKRLTQNMSNSINISGLASGVYVIEVYDGEAVRSAKFIKQ